MLESDHQRLFSTAWRRLMMPSMSLADAPPRRLTCARCGAAFDCGSTTGHCWCAEEDFRLPMPVAGEDCLCPVCLRQAARERRALPTTPR